MGRSHKRTAWEVSVVAACNISMQKKSLLSCTVKSGLAEMTAALDQGRATERLKSRLETIDLRFLLGRLALVGLRLGNALFLEGCQALHDSIKLALLSVAICCELCASFLQARNLFLLVFHILVLDQLSHVV